MSTFLLVFKQFDGSHLILRFSLENTLCQWRSSQGQKYKYLCVLPGHCSCADRHHEAAADNHPAPPAIQKRHLPMNHCCSGKASTGPEVVCFEKINGWISLSCGVILVCCPPGRLLPLRDPGRVWSPYLSDQSRWRWRRRVESWAELSGDWVKKTKWAKVENNFWFTPWSSVSVWNLSQ